MAGQFRFSFGPWNIHEGADPFGPAVRPAMDFAAKLKTYKKLGFDAVQFHDDDAVPGLDKLTPAQVAAKAKELRKESPRLEELAVQARAFEAVKAERPDLFTPATPAA